MAAPGTSDAAIRFDGVEKRFPGAARPAVSDLTLDVPEGELVAWVNYVCPVEGAQAEMEKTDPELAESPWIFPTTEFIEDSNIQQFRVLSAEEDIEYADMWSTRVMGN